MKITPYEVLERAEQLLNMGWVQGYEAVDKAGFPCEPWSEKAVAWCEVGAIKAAAHYADNEDYLVTYCMSLVNAANPFVIRLGHNTAIQATNDTMPKEIPINMIRRAKEFVLKHAKV